MKTILFTIIISGFALVSNSQTNYTQNIRGKIIDKNTQIPLIGANVVILESDPQIGTVTNEKGEFKLENISLGRIGLQVSYLGYHTVTLNNLIVQSAKELIVNIEMEEKVITTDEIVVKASKSNGEVINKMAAVSARAFTVEQTERYAGSRGDVARMAMNYAGVSGANDQRNDIIIRGNSPSGLLWILEDVEIANPNHFAFQGTTGGPVGMLNNNTLTNSDFITSAFPAQYGNGLSGVFDLKMRNGNNEKYEFLFQTGFNGFEAGAEGPLSKNKKGSFLFNYRYSTLGLLYAFGMNVGTTGVPYYQDLSFKIHIPVNRGIIDIFSLCGLSHISMLDSKSKNESDLYTSSNMDLYNGSDLGVIGLSYTRFLSDKAYAKIIVSGTGQNLWTKMDTLDQDFNPHRYLTSAHAENRLTLTSFVNKKISSKITTRYGFSINKLGFNMKTTGWNPDSSRFEDYYKDRLSVIDGIYRLNLYNQWIYKFNDNFSLHPGIHLQYLDKNNELSVEPRLGIVYKITDFQKINFGYGLHSQNPSILLLYIQTLGTDGKPIKTNSEVKSIKAHHYVAGYDILAAENLRLKVETYFQYLTKVPVQPIPSSYSALNSGASYGINYRDSMVNKGTGKNYGIEVTLEKYLFKGYYYLITASLFESKYKGSDGIWRNTAFNNNYVFNLLAGKEFQINEQKVLSFDIKGTFAGGQRKTPIDIEKSRTGSQFYTAYDESRAFSEQFAPYLKIDFKITYRKNKKRTSQEWQLYIENLTNHKNALMESFNKKKDIIQTSYQLGFFPMMNYRIYF